MNASLESELLAERWAADWLRKEGLSRKYKSRMVEYLAGAIDRVGEYEASRLVGLIGTEAVRHERRDKE